MTRKTKIRLAIIVPALLVLAVGAWVGVNMLVARQLDLIELVRIGDAEGAGWVAKWDPGQLDRKSGTSPMNLAVYLDRYEVVQALLRAGADPNKRGLCNEERFLYGQRLTPLHCVRSERMIDLLMEAGADWRTPSRPLLATPLDQLDPKMVKALLERGVDPNWSPLKSEGCETYPRTLERSIGWFAEGNLSRAEIREIAGLLLAYDATVSEEALVMARDTMHTCSQCC